MQTHDDQRSRRLYPWVGVLTGLLLVVAAVWAADFIPGDVNNDGVFDIADPTVLRRDLVGLGPGIAQLCGNGLLDPNEDCDFGELAGQICADSGLSFGTLSCGAGCTLDTSACTNTRFVDNGDGTITDNQTGLMWEQKTPGAGCLHCVDDPYSWASMMSEWISEVNGRSDDGSGATQAGLGGQTDWRVPTQAELLTIVDSPTPGTGAGCTANPCISLVFGPTASSFYWSSTSYAFDPTFAWFVYFLDGNVVTDGKSVNYRVRAVRSGPPTCGDGVVNQISEDCDAPDDSACPGQCQADCNCPGPQPICGDGTIDQPSEQCDDGNTQSGDCCSPTCFFEASNVVCRSATGACDVNEFCTGGDASCPPDRVAPQDTACDDTNFCTTGDRCMAGVCVGGARDCSALDRPCAVGVCYETSATCLADPTPREGAECGRHGIICVGGSCVCPGGSVETTCFDALDNDCDGVPDCSDFDCQFEACGPGRVCFGDICTCLGGSVETFCFDADDNDCDGDVDCADPDCQGLFCAPPGSVCDGGSCVSP